MEDEKHHHGVHVCLACNRAESVRRLRLASWGRGPSGWQLVVEPLKGQSTASLNEDQVLIEQLCTMYEDLPGAQSRLIEAHNEERLNQNRLIETLVAEYQRVLNAGRGLHAEKVQTTRKALESDLRRSIDGPPDFLSWIGEIGNENLHSHMLAALLDCRSSPNLGPLLLRAFAEGVLRRCGDQVVLTALVNWLSEDGAKYIIAEREHSVPKKENQKRGRRIDILITTSVAVLAIENKVYSSESTDQTSDYQEYLEGLGEGAVNMPVGGILLSPSGHLPGCRAWGHASYDDLWASLVLALGQIRGDGRHQPEFVFGLSYLKSLETLLPGLRQTRRPGDFGGGQ